MKSWILALAGLAVALVLAEGVVRLIPSERLGYAWVNGGFRYPPEHARTGGLPRRNALGFHDVAPRAKPEGVVRVALLGDSFVEGTTVNVQATLGRRLEHHLNAAEGPGGRRWDVVAYGRTGWGQLRQLEALREHGPDAAPDQVVTLFLHLNDLVDDLPALSQARTLERFRRIAEGRLLADFLTRPAPYLIVPGSALNRLVSHRLLLAFPPDRPSDVPVEYAVYAEEPGAPWGEAWRLHESLLLETRAASGSLGAGYAVVSASTPHGVWGAKEGLERMREAYPGMREQAYDLDGPDRRSARFCAEEGIPFLALEPVFREETADGRRLHWKHDGHWNGEGNDLAARRIADFLLELERTGRSPGPTPGTALPAAEG